MGRKKIIILFTQMRVFICQIIEGIEELINRKKKKRLAKRIKYKLKNERMKLMVNQGEPRK